MTTPFGRYRGWPLGDLPNDYVVWLYGLDDLREPLREAIEAEWQTRFGSARAWGRVPPASVVDELVSAGLRTLARRHHPDIGGDPEHMKALNSAADWVRAQVRAVA